MIVRVGLDLVEVARIERAMRRPGFVRRVLTPAERAICTTPARVAGRWAAKEAVAKAVGTHLGWQQVEILPDAQGCPQALVRDQSFMPSRHSLHVSITHERTHAAAVAILSKVEPSTCNF